MKYKLLIFLLLSCCFHISFAQREVNFWYFGNNTGIDFNSGIPEPLHDSQMKTYEGCASFSDTLGNLLFYTNGVDVWNSEHQIMENGSGLLGDTSSTQSAVIIQKPESNTMFYIFTVDDIIDKGDYLETSGLRYSIVDIALNNGLGDLTESKNISMHPVVPEKITAVKHKNNKDVWLIAHDWGNNNYRVWLITKSGISESPVVSPVGTPHVQIEPDIVINSIGQLKASPNGNKIAVCILRNSIIEILDFDNQTGIVSNPVTIFYPGDSPYGTEFSPNSSKLYFSGWKRLYHIDLEAGTPEDIINSLTEVYASNRDMGSLQLAPDGKIYLAMDHSEYLGVINKPNESAALCDFNIDGYWLENKQSRLGLPDFLQSLLQTPFFRVTNNCQGSEVKFYIENTTGIDSVEWNFRDPDSGSSNYSKLMSPEHIYNKSGIYSVILKYWISGTAYNTYENISVTELPEFNLGNDTIFCIAKNHLLKVTGKHLTYKWQDLSTNSTFNVTETGIYNVEIQNIYTTCINSDTINIKFVEIPEISLGNDTSFCENSSFTIDAYHENYTYLWNNGSQNSTLTTSNTGEYSIEVTDINSCINSDTIRLNHYFLPRFSFLNDTVICEDNAYTLNVDLPEISFLWQDGSIESSFTIFEKGKYYLTVTNKCGNWSDTINVGFRYCGDVVIPNVITPNNDNINDYFTIKGIEEEVWDLIIFNRWGNKVYQSNDYINNWNADGLDANTYFYILSSPEAELKYTGFVVVFK